MKSTFIGRADLGSLLPAGPSRAIAASGEIDTPETNPKNKAVAPIPAHRRRRLGGALIFAAFPCDVEIVIPSIPRQN